MIGFFNINKEKNFTSFDCCNKIKYKFKEKKVGHTGTLDPNATGVMQIAVGKATKLLPLLEDHTKVYLATVKFGLLTDTLDPEGKVLTDDGKVDIKIEDINNELILLSKEESQIPPIYSAIKVDGKKMYEYAREGKTVELKPRPVKVYQSSVASDLYYEDNYLCVKILLKVSKGFYVRSFVRDLAMRLGTVAIMSDLVRIETGNFNIENAKTLNEVEITDLISVEEVFSYLPRFDAKEYLVKLIKNGIELDERQMTCKSPFLVYYDNRLIAVYEPKDETKYKLVVYLGD